MVRFENLSCNETFVFILGEGPTSDSENFDICLLGLWPYRSRVASIDFFVAVTQMSNLAFMFDSPFDFFAGPAASVSCKQSD